ncbi:MAG TPA: methyltransferase [Gemmataceae bacterium]|jgi:16S rRNA (guanine1207-N2)-methyltransferase|nr:methyltransferase [Gemmataceae bacterium]
MPTRRSPRKADFPDLLSAVESRLAGPFVIVLGSPREVVDLVHALPTSDVTCYQMDLFQATRLKAELRDANTQAVVETSADLWDLPRKFMTAIFPVPFGGERGLKLDMVEQAYHILEPGGNFIVLSPYERDDLFAKVVKKVFGKIHSPMDTKNAVYWSQATGDKTRRRHEQSYRVRINETSVDFASRPGVFSYGRFDHGARALIEAVEIKEGDKIADLGCGVGTNGILTGLKAGPTGFVAFADSNLRALAVADENAKKLGLADYRCFPSTTLEGLNDDFYDVVLANPPYYAQMSIARLFAERGRQMLKPGGRFCLVTKQIDAIYPILDEVFGSCDVGELRGYYVFEATKG